jgi:hypothetical protein
MSNAPSLLHDQTLRKIMVGSSGLGIALMLASLAAVQFGKTQGLQFQWHWSIAVVMALGASWNWRFWKVIWNAYDEPGRNFRTKLITAFALLFALGAGTFLYPMRFVDAGYHFPISRGLLTAVLFLGTMFWLIYKLGRGFVNADRIETEQQAS